MKTSTLFISTLVAAAMSVPAFAVSSATTEYNGTMYSGDIYKITSSGFETLAGTSNDKTPFASGDASKYNSETGEWTSGFGGGASFGNEGWLACSSETSNVGNTLLLSAATTGDVTYTTDYQDYVWIGGLITEGEGSYTIGRAGNCNVILKGSAGVNMNIGADTTISVTGPGVAYNTISIESSGNWVVASGKTLTLTAARGLKFSDGVAISVSGGGTVDLGDITLSGGAGTISYDGGLDAAHRTLSFISANAEDGTTLNVGTVSVAAGFTGTVELKNLTSDAAGTAKTGITLSSYGVAGSKIVIDSVGDASKTVYITAETVAADVEFKGTGLTLNDGSSSGTTTFSGKITGTGNFTWGNSSVNQAFKFTGGLTEYEGDFIRENGGTTSSNNSARSVLTFGNGGEGSTEGSVSGTGTIAWGTGSSQFEVVYNYSNDVYASNKITHGILTKQGAGMLTLTGANTFTGGVTVSAGTLNVGNASALGTGATTVAADAKLQLSVALESVSGVTFNEGSKLVLSDALLAGTAMTFASDEATDITLSLITSNSISFGGQELASGDVSTLISDYVEFGSAFDAFGSKTFNYTDGTLSLTLSTIPEPSAFGLLAGLGALALVASRRRRRAK